MKKIKFLLFSFLAFSLVLLTGAEVMAQGNHSDKRQQDFKTIEANQNLTPQVVNQDHTAQLAAAKATLQERAANRGDKDVRPDQRVLPGNGPGLVVTDNGNGSGMSAKMKAKKGIGKQGELKINKPAKVQLKTPQLKPEDAAQKRQARALERRKKLRKQ